MSLEEEFGTVHDQEDIEKFGKKLLDKYGKLACECASKLDRTNLERGTKTNYKTQVRQVISELDDKNPEPRDVVEFVGSLDKKGGSKNIMIVAMKKYYNIIGEDEKAEKVHKISEMEGVTEIDQSRDMQVEEWITDEEIERIKEYILPKDGKTKNIIGNEEKSWVIDIEHKALVYTLYYTGCRVGEICRRYSGDFALQVEDIYPSKNQIHVYRLKKGGKGVKRQYRVVPEIAIDIIHEYLDYKDKDSGAIFDFTTRTAQNRIKDINEAYQFVYGEWEHMEKLTPHKFRHGRVTTLAQHTSLDKAGEYVDHSSTDITKAYRHLDTEEQKEMLPEESESEDEDNVDSDEIIDKIQKMDPEELDRVIKFMETLV